METRIRTKKRVEICLADIQKDIEKLKAHPDDKKQVGYYLGWEDALKWILRRD